MDLGKTLHLSAAGMRAQGTRLRVIAENVANAGSVAAAPGADPYRRKVVTFETELDRSLGLELVQVKDVLTDGSEFTRRFEPGHPAADKDGYVMLPNVRVLLEMADMREAQRSYEANLKMLQASRTMLQRTIGLLN